MNNKITDRDLSQSLVGENKLSQESADKFVELMFSVLNEGLRQERLVKIKGLGTFKVLAVSPRKSVDVNTGQPIIIEGRDKINFTPENGLRDLVNAPFAQFDTVILNDGVEFSDEDDSQKPEPDSASENTLSEQPEDVSQPAEEPAEEPATESRSEEPKSEPVVEAEDKDVSVAVKTIETEAPKEPKTVPETVVESESVVEPVKTEPVEKPVETSPQEESMEAVDEPKAAEESETIDEADDETAISDNGTVISNEDTVSDEDTDSDDNLLAKELHSSHRLNYILIGVAAVVLIACGCGFFYFYSQLSQRDARIASLEQRMQSYSAPHKQIPVKKQQAAEKTEVTNETEVAEKPIEPVSNSEVKAVTPAQEPVKENAGVKNSKVEKPAKAETSQKEALASKYDADPRVRTGAYIITGISSTVKVKPGQTLSRISRLYLGPGMECYIEAVNPGVKELKEGQKINIPALELRKHHRNK